MNSYIMNTLKQIKQKLAANETLSYNDIDSITGELEMMKMEIEQHIDNMPQFQEHQNSYQAAKNAVRCLSEILDLLYELIDGEQQKEFVWEIIYLIDEICY